MFINNYWRLYYYFKGTPIDRVGGPWWSRDFPAFQELEYYLETLRPFLQRYAIEKLAITTRSSADPRDIHPPKDVEVVDT